MKIRNKDSYSDGESIFGLGNALLNYIASNNILEDKKLRQIHFEEHECLSLLKDVKNVVEYVPKNNDKVFKIEIGSTAKKNQQKIGKIKNVIEYLKKLNSIFSESGVFCINVIPLENTEII